MYFIQELKVCQCLSFARKLTQLNFDMPFMRSKYVTSLKLFLIKTVFANSELLYQSSLIISNKYQFVCINNFRKISAFLLCSFKTTVWLLLQNTYFNLFICFWVVFDATFVTKLQIYKNYKVKIFSNSTTFNFDHWHFIDTKLSRWDKKYEGHSETNFSAKMKKKRIFNTVT